VTWTTLVGRRAAAATESVLIALIALIVTALSVTTLVAAAGRPSDAANQLEGTLVARHGDDFRAGRMVHQRFFLLHDGVSTPLRFRGDRPSDGAAGTAVEVRGRREGRHFLVAAGGVQAAGGGGQNATGTTGTRSVAVVLIKFSNTATEPYPPAYAAGIAFDNTDSVAAYYAATSWGQLTLTGRVFGWYTVSETDETCATSAWSTAASAAAAAEGIDLASFDHVVYAFPRVSACAWSGLATMPGRSAWLNGSSGMTLRTMAHELGHNLGTHHANALSCSVGGVRVALSNNCTSSEYGDPFSVMGNASHFEHTNFARGNFGWVPTGSTESISQAGDYTLAPIESSTPAASQVLRIPRGDGTYLTLEYRQPSPGFDSFSMSDPVVNGVTVRVTGSETTRVQSRLVDATPGTSTFGDAPLLPSMSLTDPVSGASIRTLSTSTSWAVVRVSFNEPAATPAATATPAPPSAPPIPEPTPAPTPAPTPSPTPAPTQPPPPNPDGVAPSAPTGLQVALGKGKKVSLTWSPSTDNVGVVGYRVFRNGSQVGSASGTTFIDPLRGKAASYTYYVIAYDAAGNVSVRSSPVTFSA